MYDRKNLYSFQMILNGFNLKRYIFMQISEVETFCIGKQTQLFFLKGEGQVVFFYGEKYNCSVGRLHQCTND